MRVRRWSAVNEHSTGQDCAHQTHFVDTDVPSKEIAMNTIFANVDVGRKNMWFGIVLFLLLGVVVGTPLTVDMFGGSLMTSDQYQGWKVIHAYGVFLAFINYFLGLAIDRFEMPRGQKEIVSWSFLAAGLVGGAGRMTLALLSSLNQFGRAASLVETVLFVLGTVVLVSGQIQQKRPADLTRDTSRVPHAHAG